MSLAERLTPKVLTLDIETSPNLVWTYDLWDAKIGPDKIVQPSRVLCFAAKWLDQTQVQFYSEYHDGRDVMVSELWHLMDAADVLVTYNGVKFDVPHIMRTFIENGYPPPSPWIDVDLYKFVRSRYKFPSNRLGAVTDYLGLPSKLETGVSQLWKRVLDNDEKAWAAFKRYNKQDVVATEILYRTLACWMKGAHVGLWSGDMSTCPSCGSTQLHPMGMTYTKTAAYAKCVCECGAWCKVLPSGQTRPI